MQMNSTDENKFTYKQMVTFKLDFLRKFDVKPKYIITSNSVKFLYLVV